MYCIILNTSITGYNSVLLDISIPGYPVYSVLLNISIPGYPVCSVLLDISIPGYPVCSVLLDISVKEQEIQDGFPLCKY